MSSQRHIAPLHSELRIAVQNNTITASSNIINFVENVRHRQKAYLNRVALMAGLDMALLTVLTSLTYWAMGAPLPDEQWQWVALGMGLTTLLLTGAIIGTRYYQLEDSQHSLGKALFVGLALALPGTGLLMIAQPPFFVSFMVALIVGVTLFTLVSAFCHYVLGQTFQLHVAQSRFYRLEQKMKRVVDFTLAFGGFLAIVPLLAVIALAICLESEGSPLYSQTRVGLREEKFKMWKFRSMVNNAARLEQQHSAVLFKSQNDPRITQVGWVIRKLSLDELPQLWNILVGDMSLVGPRPPMEDEFTVMNRRHRRKFEVVPGVTGLWQITGRVNDERDFDSVAHYDTAYIDHWSLMQDLLILMKTVPVVLLQKGAY